MINTHLSLDKIDSAELYLKKLLPFIPKISKREQGRCRKFEAQVAFEKGELSHAETCVRAAIPLRKDDREGLLQSYILLGKIYEKQDKIAAAHEAFQRALEYAKNPATKDFLFKNEALTIFQHQIALHNAQQYHKQAITTCDSADLLISALRQLYETDESKLFLAQNVKKLYEEGIIAAAALQDIDKAFYYSEKCKAVLLYASIKANEAANSLPKSAQDSLVSLKNSHDIATFQTQKGNNSEKNIDAMQQYTQYLKQLEQRYPEYAQKKRTTVSSLPQIKAYLPQNQLMIAYFWGEKRQFCFVLEKEKQTIFPINAQKDSLKSLLVSIETKKSRIEQQAKAAYLQLIPPQLQQNTSLRWLIIPDGILHKLPFEALIKEGKYLVHSHAISYSYSATIWQNPSQNADSKEDIVIAPPFNAYKTYQPSLGDLQEKKFLQAFPNATIWEGKRQDIVAAFSQEKNKNYHFIYAYTHSFSDSLPQNCRIVLADTFLTIKDIESLHIHADLWILASCESGLGRFHEGEGVMSLARSFIHAGCRSVMPTLWKANAESVRKILEYFDAYITEGYAKDIALQKAKIQYLAESESENRLPDMWAMQILIGDAGVCSHQGSWWKWLIGGIAVLGAVYIARRFSQI